MKKILALMVVSLLCATIVAAQDYLGSISGKITDEEGRVISRAKVMISSPALMGGRALRSTDNGLYRVINLPPGIYTVTVSKDNYSTYVHKDLTIRADLNITLNIKLRVGSFEQAITISGLTPIIDTTETGQKFNMSGDFHRSLPVSVRSEVSEILGMLPGVSQPPWAGSYSYFSVNGTDFLDSPPTWSVDGANASGFEYGIMSTRVNLDIIEETSVDITRANPGNSMGRSASISIVTKSGGNELSGSTTFGFQPQSWNDTNVEEASPRDTKYYLFGATLGGPILKDKLWYFLSGRYQNISDGVSRSAEDIANLRAIFPDFQPFRNEKKKPDVFGKLSYRHGDDHNFFASYQKDWGPETFGGSNDTQNAFIKEENFGYFVNTNWNWALNDSMFMNTSVSYTNKPRRRQYEDNTRTGRTYYPEVYLGPGGNLKGDWWTAVAVDGVHEAHYEMKDQQLRIRSDLDVFLESSTGSHALTFGVVLSPYNRHSVLSKNEANPRTEGLVAVDPNDFSKGFIPFKREVWALGDSEGGRNKMQLYEGYVSDSWRVSDRLTVQAGARLSFIKAKDSIEGEEVFSPPAATVVSPTLGFTYALTSDRNNIVRANYARRYDAIYKNSLPSSQRSPTQGLTTYYDNDLDGVFEVVDVTQPGLLNYGLPESAWEGIDLFSYSDDFSVGYTRELPWNTVLTADYIFRRTGGGHVMALNASIEDGVWKGPIHPGFQYWAKKAPVNNTFNHNEFQNVEFVLTKAFGNNLQFLMGYTLESLVFKGEYGPDEANMFIEPASTYENNGGRAHLFRMDLVYRAPWDVVVGVTGQITGGEFSGPIMENLDPSDPRLTAHGPQVLVIDGELYFNPLYSSRRLAFDKRSDGKWRAETTYNFNLRLEKRFDLMRRYQVSAAIDIFNVFNSVAYRIDNRGTTVGSEYYGEFTGRTDQSPRAAQATLKFSF